MLCMYVTVCVKYANKFNLKKYGNEFYLHVNGNSFSLIGNGISHTSPIAQW